MNDQTNKTGPPFQNPKLTHSQKTLPPIYPRVENKETYPFCHGEFHTTGISFQDLNKTQLYKL